MYFKWRYNPIGIDCPWSMKDYGMINYAVLAADIADADHTALVAHTDVLAIPINLDSTMTAGAVNTAKAFLENWNIPAGWINTGVTYRSVLRTITSMFLFMQRVTAILGHTVDVGTISLSTQVRNIPVDIRNALAQAASEMGYNYSAVTGTTTLRTVLKAMADAWGSQPIYFGFVTL
jgi:hypothetical protein